MTESNMMEKEITAKAYPEYSRKQTVFEMDPSGIQNNRAALSAEQQAAREAVEQYDEEVRRRFPKLETFLTIKPTDRVKRLRETYFGIKTPKMAIERERILVRVMQETEGEPMVTRRAKAFAAIVRERPIEIYPDELLVGWLTGSPSSVDRICEGSLGPGGAVAGITTATGTDRDPTVEISEEDRKIIEEEIVPYWRGSGNWERTRSFRYNELLPQQVKDAFFGGDDEDYLHDLLGRPGFVQVYFHVGHSTAQYWKVMEKGFLGIKQEAEERLAKVDYHEPEEVKKIPFLKGVIMAMEAAAGIGQRFATRARQLVEAEEDIQRKAELLKIAEICEQVPAKPARTFHEALQALWFTHLLHWWETPLVAAVSPGRIDQYLYPYYEADIREGRMTREEAQELIDSLFLRMNRDEATYGQAPPSHHIEVGGYKPDGTDATNELSYMILEGIMHVRLREPNIAVQIHGKTPDDLQIKAAQLSSLGTGHPMFLNSEEIVANMLGRGNLGGPAVPLEHARMSSGVGCHEPCVPGLDSGYPMVNLLNVGSTLEYVFTNGWHRYWKKKMGLETGDPRQFQSFEEVREAYLKQLAWQMKNINIGSNLAEQILADMFPTVYQSAIMGDCIEKGICKEEGGARYNFGVGVDIIGAVDIGNSLAAIKKLVFEEKRITMAELCDALEQDFEGYEALRRRLLQTPKFGNDDDTVDEQVSWVMHTFCEEVKQYQNTRGGHMLPLNLPLVGYHLMGDITGALPSGRRAGEVFSTGIEPTLGSDLNGPTAVLQSVGKVDATEVSFCQSLNMRIAPQVFEQEGGYSRMLGILRTFVDQGIHHIQFNTVSSDTLRAAQQEPEKYADLVVRFAGYSSYFVQLTKQVQDSIIARTEQGL